MLPLAKLLGALLSAGDLLRNLVPVIAGTIVGGSLLVAQMYRVVYLVAGGAPPAGR